MSSRGAARSDRSYWDRHPKNYDRSMASSTWCRTCRALAALRRVVTPGGRIVVPTFCHDETALSWLASRALAVTGFPGHRRFTTRSLRQAVEEAGIRVTRTETLPGLIPIGYLEGVSG